MYDMHFHLSWLEYPARFLQEADEIELGGFGVTITPDEYRTQLLPLQVPDNWACALGFHPWYAAQADVATFCELAKHTHAIGEIGLDFNKTPEHKRDTAYQQFVELCSAIQPESVLSLHAVASAEAVLDALEESGRLQDCACIFHWFSDSGEAFVRARQAGCYFSINPRQLETRRGRSYISQLNPKKMLLESDLPESTNRATSPCNLKETLTTMQEAFLPKAGAAAQGLIAQAKR